jgi:hypothetical protein
VPLIRPRNTKNTVSWTNRRRLFVHETTKTPFRGQIKRQNIWLIHAFFVILQPETKVTLVTTYGLKYGVLSGIFQRVVTLESLFAF